MAAILVAAGALASPAQAQVASSDDLIQQGIELRRANKPQEARDLFLRAYAQAPSPRAAAQLGLAEQTLGSWLDAEKHLGEALRAKDDAWVAKNRAALEQSAATVAERLAWLDVQGNVAGAEVTVNGERVGKTPLAAPVRVIAGTVVIDVQAEGYVRLTRHFDVAAQRHARESVVLVPLARDAARADAVPAAAPVVSDASPAKREAPSAIRDDRWKRPVGWTAIGVGVVGLGIGAYFGVRTLNASSELHDLCPTKSTCTDEGLRKNDDAHTWALISTIGIGAGIAGAAAGTWLLLTSPRATSAGVRVVPNVGANGGTLHLVGAW